jgi:hypothetical protein
VSSRDHWATVHVETDNAVYVGRVLVAAPRSRFRQVLRDERPFLFMTEVSINDSEAVEPLVAVNKTFIRRAKVLHEAERPETLGV